MEQSGKRLLDLTVVYSEREGRNGRLLKLRAQEELPDIMPGQFAEVLTDGHGSTLLRRPISINFADRQRGEIWLLVAVVGEGTRWMASLPVGSRVNVLLPLGKGFTLPSDSGRKVLLAGGGVGVAPLLYLGAKLREKGISPTFLLGARSGEYLYERDLFEALGRLFITTDDGSLGEKGVLTGHSILEKESFDFVYACGPKPMMEAVALYADGKGIECEVSLENKMACGLGACLCCVEETRDGNVCVCTEGPVFNTKKLLWNKQKV